MQISNDVMALVAELKHHRTPNAGIIEDALIVRMQTATTDERKLLQDALDVYRRPPQQRLGS